MAVWLLESFTGLFCTLAVTMTLMLYDSLVRSC